MQDEYLLKKLKRKDEKALEEMIEQYHKLLWVVVENVLGNIGTAEDIEECISDVFVRFWNKPQSFDPQKGSLKTFLCIMARSMAINRYRKLSKNKTVEITNHLKTHDDLATTVCHKELSRELYTAIHQMKEPDKEIFIRRYFYDEKPSHIAGKILLSVKEVENRLYRGKKKLKNMLKEVLS